MTGLHLQVGFVREIRPQLFVTGDRSPISARLMFVSSDRTWPLRERKPLTSARVAMDSYAERPGVRRVMPGHRTVENTSAVRPEDSGLCSAPLSRFIDRTISLVWAL